MSPRLRIFLLFLFHFFGLVACYIDVLKPLFLAGTPLHLILITIFLLWDGELWNLKFCICLIAAFAIGMASEMVGVNTGWLYGHYYYTDLLGFKWYGVPLLIGVTWIGTTYACNVITTSWNTGALGASVSAAVLMVLFDILLEKFATAVPLWQWVGGHIPLYNYVCWFAIGLIISIIFQFQKIKKPNVVAPYYLLSQLIFFICYLLIQKLG